MRVGNLLLPLGALLVIAAAPAQPGQRKTEWDAQYKERFDTLMKAGGVITDYAPMEKVAGANPAALAVVPAEQRTVSAAALEKAATYAAANNSSALLVWRDGGLQAAWYPQGAGPEKAVVSKSLSKPLTAIAIGRAMQLGKIRSVDQPVGDFIPEWKGTPKEAILIRHLLDMRSGLLPQMVSSDPDHPINRAYIDPDHGWHLINNYPLTHKPGSHYGYNNATAELVAIVIERATGVRYADFIGHQVLQPLNAAGGEIWVDREGGLAHSGCCMMMPPETWLKLGVLLLNDGKVGEKRLLPAGFAADMARGTPENPHYGMGVWVAGPYLNRRSFAGANAPGPKVLHSAPYLDRDLYLFDGNSNQVVYISPATRMVILRTGGNPPAAPEWDNSYLPNLLIAGAKPLPGLAAPMVQQ